MDAETIAWCGKDDCRHLRLQEAADLEQVLSSLIFADGCAAALVSREPRGLALGGSTTTIAAAAADQITWRIGSQGFDMKLAGSVPGSIGAVLPNQLPVMLQSRPADQVAHWAVHPGGRSVLDAVERALQLGPEALADSRAVLRRYGNMSSADRRLGRGARHRPGADRGGPESACWRCGGAGDRPRVWGALSDGRPIRGVIDPDVVISTLFAHHLNEKQLVAFLRWMEDHARLGWMINDLHRHPLPYWIARRGPVILGMNRLVRHDAAVSVARAFVRQDWERLLSAAGIAGPPATVRWCFPFRYAVGRIKSQ